MAWIVALDGGADPASRAHRLELIREESPL